jgi:hypothetical protein
LQQRQASPFSPVNQAGPQFTQSVSFGNSAKAQFPAVCRVQGNGVPIKSVVAWTAMKMATMVNTHHIDPGRHPVAASQTIGS